MVSNDESCWRDAIYHPMICEFFGIEKVKLKRFRYLFYLIMNERIQSNKYLGGICWVVEECISTNGVDCLFVNLSINFI